MFGSFRSKRVQEQHPQNTNLPNPGKQEKMAANDNANAADALKMHEVDVATELEMLKDVVGLQGIALHESKLLKSAVESLILLPITSDGRVVVLRRPKEDDIAFIAAPLCNPEIGGDVEHSMTLGLAIERLIKKEIGHTDDDIIQALRASARLLAVISNVSREGKIMPRLQLFISLDVPQGAELKPSGEFAEAPNTVGTLDKAYFKAGMKGVPVPFTLPNGEVVMKLLRSHVLLTLNYDKVLAIFAQ